jgi:hypothetical protein
LKRAGLLERVVTVVEGDAQGRPSIARQI